MRHISFMRVKNRLNNFLSNWHVEQNDWTNKNVIVFGDSIVAGQELVREETLIVMQYMLN